MVLYKYHKRQQFQQKLLLKIQECVIQFLQARKFCLSLIRLVRNTIYDLHSHALRNTQTQEFLLLATIHLSFTRSFRLIFQLECNVLTEPAQALTDATKICVILDTFENMHTSINSTEKSSAIACSFSFDHLTPHIVALSLNFPFRLAPRP